MINKKFYPEGYIIKTEDFIRLEVISKDDEFLPFRLSEKVNKVKSNDFRFRSPLFFHSCRFKESQIKMFDRNNINIYKALSSFIQDVLKDRLTIIGFYNPNMDKRYYWHPLISLKLITFEMIDELLKIKFSRHLKINKSNIIKSKWVTKATGKQNIEIEQVLIEFLAKLNCNTPLCERTIDNTLYTEPNNKQVIELRNKVNILFKRLK